jgi:hypothetical protein
MPFENPFQGVSSPSHLSTRAERQKQKPIIGKNLRPQQ